MPPAKKPTATTTRTLQYRVAFKGLQTAQPETWDDDWFGPYQSLDDAQKRAGALESDTVNYRDAQVQFREVSQWEPLP